MIILIAGKDVEKLDISCIVGGNVIRHVLIKLNRSLPYNSTTPLLDIYSRKFFKIHVHTKTWALINKMALFITPKLETTQISIKSK